MSKAKKRKEKEVDPKSRLTFELDGSATVSLNKEKILSIDYIPYKKKLGILVVESIPNNYVVKRIRSEDFVSFVGERKEMRDLYKWLSSCINNEVNE